VRQTEALQLVLSCEHATRHVPREYRPLFRGAAGVLKSHQGWDPGTLELGNRLSGRLGCPLIVAEVSRLLIELNRSLHHPRLFSSYSRGLPADERNALVERYWQPYRAAVSTAVESQLRRGKKVLHLSLHSFTPELDGEVRGADAGLLFDPKVAAELALCRSWQAQLRSACPDLVVRRNYPYRGTSDGLTTALRKRFAGQRYLGIELEISQRFPLGSRRRWNQIQEILIDSVARTVGE
jgi:predicted N-formylglutamate amidohydrolase